MDTPGVVDMNLLNDTPGGVGIKEWEEGDENGPEKAETARIFEGKKKDAEKKEIQKKFKKSLKKVLRFSEF